MSTATGTREQALVNGRKLLASDPRAAERQAREMLAIDVNDGAALRLLGAALRRLGSVEQAEAAEREAIRASAFNPTLVEAANAIAGRDLAHAERILRPYLVQAPDDAAAHLMLARIAADVGATGEAVQLLQRCLQLSPAYIEAWLLLARVHADSGALDVALTTLGEGPSSLKDDLRALRLKAALLGRLGDYAAAATAHEQVLTADPRRPSNWVAYGHLLRTVGRKDDAIAAYRQALAADPRNGEAWWSLTNLKTEAMSDEDIAAMLAAVDAGGSDENNLHLHFALGKAMEDRCHFERAFKHFREANRLRRLTLPYDRSETERAIARAKADLSDLGTISGEGNPLPGPIFIVGMPRSGSTLLEQILASHSQIEGTSELPYIPALAQQVSSKLTAERYRALGREYLDLAQRHRKTDRPFFIDKQPNNWMNVGFIRKILPEARIIDIRRHPLASCVANFRQHFGQGQAFSYDLGDMAHYYGSYAALMDEYHRGLPGVVHRIHYEHLVDDPEAEVGRLLDHLGLSFEAACLLFHQNDRAVRTPSSEQVRQPIYRSALDDWINYEPWLGSVRDILDRLVAEYPS